MCRLNDCGRSLCSLIAGCRQAVHLVVSSDWAAVLPQWSSPVFGQRRLWSLQSLSASTSCRVRATGVARAGSTCCSVSTAWWLGCWRPTSWFALTCRSRLLYKYSGFKQTILNYVETENVITHADGSRTSIVIILVCVWFCLSVRMIKPKRLKLLTKRLNYCTIAKLDTG